MIMKRFDNKETVEYGVIAKGKPEAQKSTGDDQRMTFNTPER